MNSVHECEFRIKKINNSNKIIIINFVNITVHNDINSKIFTEESLKKKEIFIQT